MYKISWLDYRDRYGIAVDSEGNEYYLFSNLVPKDAKSGSIIEAVAYSCSTNKGSAMNCLKDIVVKENTNKT